MHIKFNNSSRSENKIKQLPLSVCPTFGEHFGFISVSTSKLDRKIQYHENRTFLFCLSIDCNIKLEMGYSSMLFDHISLIWLDST